MRLKWPTTNPILQLACKYANWYRSRHINEAQYPRIGWLSRSCLERDTRSIVMLENHAVTPLPHMSFCSWVICARHGDSANACSQFGRVIWSLFYRLSVVQSIILHHHIQYHRYASPWLTSFFPTTSPCSVSSPILISYFLIQADSTKAVPASAVITI